MSVLLLVRCDCFITYQQSACALEQGRSNEVDPAMLQVPQDWEPKCRRIRVETGAWYPPDESRFGRCCCSLLLELESCSSSCHVIRHYCVVGVENPFPWFSSSLGGPVMKVLPHCGHAGLS